MHDPLPFWSRWLQVASAAFALQSASWIGLGTLDPFGVYDRALADALFGRDVLTAGETRVFAFANVLLGATSAGFFVLLFFLARIPFRRGERWAFACIASGVLTWFVLDSAFSIRAGAAFNALYVNLPCLLVLAVPLVATARRFAR